MHYENLKLYESLGLEITKIHRGIKFEESAWLKEYINLNTKLRIEAKQSGKNFEVDCFQTNDFHYNYIKTTYGNKAKLLFTDPDSRI